MNKMTINFYTIEIKFDIFPVAADLTIAEWCCDDLAAVKRFMAIVFVMVFLV